MSISVKYTLSIKAGIHQNKEKRMIFIKERIGRLIKDVEALVYPDEIKIDSYKIKKTRERFRDISRIDTSDWEELHREEIWGGNQEYFWFETFILSLIHI